MSAAAAVIMAPLAVSRPVLVSASRSTKEPLPMKTNTMNSSSRLWLVLLLAALALTTSPLWAQSGITEHAVQFPRGKSGTTIPSGQWCTLPAIHPQR